MRQVTLYTKLFSKIHKKFRNHLNYLRGSSPSSPFCLTISATCMQVQIVVGPWYNCFMTTNVSGPGGIRNNINHLHDNHESCKKCNGVIYLRTLGCGRCLRSAQKLNQNNSLDSFDVAVQNDSEWGYNRSMVANTNLGAVAGNNEQVEARMVEATWLTVSITTCGLWPCEPRLPGSGWPFLAAPSW